MDKEEAIKQNREVTKELYSCLDKIVEETNRDVRNTLRYKIHDCMMKQLNIIKDVGK